MLATIRQRPLDLKRQLLARVSLFALIVLVLGTVAALFETRYRVRNDIQRTGQTIRQLVTDEIDRSGPAYSRTLSDNKVDLAPLKPIGQLLSFCIEMSDLYSHVIEHRCFANPVEVPELFETLMRGVIGKDAVLPRKSWSIRRHHRRANDSHAQLRQRSARTREEAR